MQLNWNRNHLSVIEANHQNEYQKISITMLNSTQLLWPEVCSPPPPLPSLSLLELVGIQQVPAGGC